MCTPRLLAVFACLWLCSFAVACREGSADLRADRLEVQLQVLADGSVAARETLTLEVGARPIDRFDRRVSGEWADEFIDVSASLDGVRLSEGNTPGTVRVRRASDLHVQWRFPEMSNSTHTFVLAYRAMGVVGVAGHRGTLRWPLLQAGRQFRINVARVALTLPNGMIFLASPSVVGGGEWRIAKGTGGLVAERDGVEPTEAALLTTEVTMASLAVAQPRWQYMSGRARDLTPAFISAGLFIIVTGIGVLWIIRFQYPRPKPAASAGTEPSAPSLSAAMRMAVLHGRHIRGVPELLAVVLDVMVRDQPNAVLEHERLVAEDLLPQTQTKAGASGHAWSGSLPRGLRRRFRRALAEDLVRAGLADADRISVASGLRRAGFAVLVLGLVSSFVVPRLLGELGMWPMAVPASIVIVAGMLFVAGGSFHILTPAGERAARDWRER